jgi:alanine or glycine:cation symporter, AGCS family
MQTTGNPMSVRTAFKWSTLLVVLLVGGGTIFVLHSRGLKYRYFRHGF